MVWQVLSCQEDFGMRVSNLVAMGQGEPFLNYDNVIAALHFMNSPEALGIGARHISVSTCGVLQGIRRFGEENEQYTLAISLHSAIQEQRDALMPGCTGVKLPELKNALRGYQRDSGRRVTFEYLMIDGITDTDDSLDALVDFCQGLLAHVNLLKINHIDGSPFEPTPKRRLEWFQKRLESAGIETTIRW
jgi:23S rRNA (adenine2503-C2)-methyltransferase